MARLDELQEKYNLELDRIVNEINENKAQKVLVQLPDGLKQNATEIVDYLKAKTNVEVAVWLGSCFGACDVPESDADLVVQFGHAPWN